MIRYINVFVILIMDFDWFLCVEFMASIIQCSVIGLASKFGIERIHTSSSISKSVNELSMLFRRLYYTGIVAK